MSNLPMKTASWDLHGRPKYMLAAPCLQGGRCSDCGVAMVRAGEGDLGVCPSCYGLLWHKDWSAELRRAREQAVAAAAALAKEVKAAREKVRRCSHVVSTKMPSASTMTLKTQRRRLVGLLKGRAEALWRERI